ncbi:MAG: 30S ribosomal protein S3 [Holosporales bacterium]|jgi:small subunit ribosomal protein S3|nr:30S ribosomal protein S3 [Holosporales bacterium]
MGQKINPHSLRLGIIRNWNSCWFSKRDFADRLHEDHKVRAFIKKKLTQGAVSKVSIERMATRVVVSIHTARPGVVIGKKGSDIEALKKEISGFVGGDVVLNIVEIRKPEIDAELVAENIASQIEKRIGFRRAIKRAMQSALRFGAQGIRVNCSGRLGGAEIARMEWYREGQVPLHTLRADIDYGFRDAFTTYGCIGVKVWIYKGEKYDADAVFLPGKLKS